MHISRLIPALVSCFWLSTATAQDVDYDVIKHSDIADGRSKTLKPGFMNRYQTQFGYDVKVGDSISVNVAGGTSSHSTTVAGGVSGRGLGAGAAHTTTVGAGYFTHNL